MRFLLTKLLSAKKVSHRTVLEIAGNLLSLRSFDRCRISSLYVITQCSDILMTPPYQTDSKVKQVEVISLQDDCMQFVAIVAY